jgi:ferredoxin-NADP reductase
MEGTAVRGRLTWQVGEVVGARKETARTRSITLAVTSWQAHRPGQHVDVRLTAEDGYQVERSYSIASPPEEGPRVMLTVERLDDGEVSPYLVDELRIGDKLEFRGPIGGYFVWHAQLGGPLLLIAGGSGIVPLIAMIRHRAAVGSTVPVRLLYTLTRAPPAGWTGYRRRIDTEMLRDVAWPSDRCPLAFICGPTPLVEAAATSLVLLGHDPTRIKTERFGPTGADRGDP